ncbi:MAG TPA: NADH-quinone oxidoreductase subunit C [Acidimicrobiia bacterium]
MSDLAEQFPDLTWSQSHGQQVVQVPRESWTTFAAAAQEAGYDLLSDITAVDWLDRRPSRFEVVANLTSTARAHRLRVMVSLDANDPVVPSLVPIWPGANFPEREVFDLFGIHFEGHPDLTRILMPDDWEGHPLRKDFGTGEVPVQFKASHKVN